jgi:hypothetical protein
MRVLDPKFALVTRSSGIDRARARIVSCVPDASSIPANAMAALPKDLKPPIAAHRRLIASRAGEIQKAPNELIKGIGNGNQLDCRATQSAKSGDSQMATLGEIDGTTVHNGQRDFKP